MPPRISSLKFLLLGASDCNNPKAITKKQILQWQEEGIITYLGANKDVRPFIESSSCVVLPSFYKEGVPRVLLEAMSMGKPIITTNVSGCKELITPKIGSMCQAKDSVSLAKSMSKMLHLSPRERIQMKQNARNFVLTKHDKRLIVERYINAAQIYSLS